MRLSIYKQEGSKKTYVGLLLPGEESTLLNALKALEAQTGLYVDEYGTTKLYVKHINALINIVDYLTNNLNLKGNLIKQFSERENQNIHYILEGD